MSQRGFKQVVMGTAKQDEVISVKSVWKDPGRRITAVLLRLWAGNGPPGSPAAARRLVQVPVTSYRPACQWRCTQITIKNQWSPSSPADRTFSSNLSLHLNSTISPSSSPPSLTNLDSPLHPPLSSPDSNCASSASPPKSNTESCQF